MSCAPQYTLLSLPHNAGIAGVLGHSHPPAPEFLHSSCQHSQPRSVRPLASRNAHKMTSQTPKTKPFYLFENHFFFYILGPHRNTLTFDAHPMTNAPFIYQQHDVEGLLA